MAEIVPNYTAVTQAQWKQQGIQDDAFALANLFVPKTLERIGEAYHEGFSFAHYTNADTGIKILKLGEFWLRNTTAMNDSSEIMHGYHALAEAHNKIRTRLEAFSRDLFGSGIDDITQGYDEIINNTHLKTWIGCLSEFRTDIDPKSLGRLSMWRAYGGGDKGVALIVNPKPIIQFMGSTAVRTYPVRYVDSPDVLKDYEALLERMDADRDLLKRNGPALFATMIQFFYDTIVFGTKHKGFAEENEWRLVYRHEPKAQHLKQPKLDVETINGVPQVVQKLVLKQGISGSAGSFLFDDLIQRVIIGPGPQSQLINDAFYVTMLMNEFRNPHERITQSTIPLRK